MSTPPIERTPLWRRPAFRALIIQALLLAGLAALIAMMIGNALTNLEARGITTGFDFLGERAGFSIPQTLIDYSGDSSYARTFVVGLLNTLLVSGLGILAATLIGFAVGIARLSPNWLLARLAAAFVETFRNIPLLVQILFWYFAVLQALPSPRQSMSLLEAFFLNVRGLIVPAPVPEPGFGLTQLALVVAILAVVALGIYARRLQQRTGKALPVYWLGSALIIGLPLLVFVASGSPLAWDVPSLKGFNFSGGITVIPELMALWLALSIYTASFIAEIVRSGIQSVPKGQIEASRAIGLPGNITLRKVVIPQAMRVIVPQLTSQYLNLIKNSSLATAIGYPDLVAVFAGTSLNQTGQAIEIIAMTMAVYLTISLVVSALMNVYNARTLLKER
ncbi:MULTISPECIES: amino acid ABC transporter permease [unclassified Halomonas]|uniref:amino acid ABC transporter permease n=1 Tax=unclassified Halomonas TaxID=2609666 RepID=UPI000C97C284|nr:MULTISPECIES: amino acid ABC transporter permease [unclassified Halomonas]MBR9772427.1 amino acid ABC transporter permease [Gammaproteobacteria bacterium]MAR73579.1 amino acid ABC transporter permease [Halomonas sp.]MBR9880381.1 amino acid ABC transporter permease [Gammaproteobacteria bacterium]MBY5940773.1 amino acid ABC transporter permease [Halomonas sp. DP5N14-9]MBY6111039.1 amino acid ABC transporter permease [Halomonas sp. DP1Y21-3]